MAKIHINNPKQVINGGAKKYYFKVKGLGGPKGDKGDTGATGLQGPQGPQGNAATISVGSTTTLPVGYDATVENVGSIYNAVLNFGIPQGPRGPQGATGAKGDKGDKGEQGNPGPQGEKGANATVTVGTTTTTEPGTQAYAWNSSSSPNNAVINFNIPRGATGSQGPQGIQGPTGPAGADGQDGQNFTPTIVDTLPAVGDESNLYLTPKAHTTSTATGNPIEATITAQAGQLESFQLDGDIFQQTYSGINLLDNSGYNTGSSNSVSYTRNADGTYTLDGTASAFVSFRMGFVQFDTETQVYLTGAPDGASMKTFSINLMKNGSTSGWQTDAFAEGRAYTLEANTPYYFAIVVRKNTDTSGLVFKPQIELGSSGSDYQPYVGGQPSPNPDYPQPIQTVTGEQTVSINGTNYPISLGSLELCKLGSYQDYIWKDGENWKVHKATGKIVFDSSTPWSKHATTGGNVFILGNTGFVGYLYNTGQVAPAKMNTDRVIALGSSADNVYGAFGITADSQLRVFRGEYDSAYTPQIFNGQMVGNYIYGALTAPTDTTITDTTLITQLEAIRTASLENGANTITNTATGTNLAGDMEIGYYGFNPTNRYDKFIWLDLNNNYEQIGGE